MIGNTVDLIALPTNIWMEEPLMGLVEEAMVSERRIQKNSNIEIERLRYGMICKQIENLANLKKNSSLVRQLGPEYVDNLEHLRLAADKDVQLKAIARTARFGATFYPPNLLGKNMDAFSQLIEQVGLSTNIALQERIAFVRSLGMSSFGLVEIPRPFSIPIFQQMSETIAPIITDRMSLSSSWVSEEEGEDLIGQEDTLYKEIRQALATDGVVNFSNPTHIPITKVLHEYVYDSIRTTHQTIRVVYSDGTEAERFPIACRSNNLKPEETQRLFHSPILRASLLSIRHLEQDFEVDMAWFLNQQVSRPRSFAETDYFCYEKSIDLLEKMVLPARLYLYQTGLQPAVVGFYRALINWMNQKPERQIIVIPQFYRRVDDCYIEGNPWL